MKEIWKYYLRLVPIRIPLGSRIHERIDIEKSDQKLKINKCCHDRLMKGRCFKTRKMKEYKRK